MAGDLGWSGGPKASSEQRAPQRADGGRNRGITTETLTRVTNAIDEGDLVVYPTETVYGLGGDALEEAAIERVFDLKDRPRDAPISMGVASVDAVEDYVHLGARERAFLQEFLPGPVTVVCEARAIVPRVLTGGRDRVGVRVPDHEGALAVLERSGPLTATSANVTGEPGVRRVAALDERIRSGVAVVVDAGETAGGGSTVVDVARGEIHRRGARADAVRTWLAESPA